jgi:hypothetical protein
VALILLDHWFPPSRSCRIDLGGFGCLHLLFRLDPCRYSSLLWFVFPWEISCLESPHSVWFWTLIFVSLYLSQNYNYVEPMGARGSTIPDGQRSSHNRRRSPSGFAAALLGAGQPAMAGHPDHPYHTYQCLLARRQHQIDQHEPGTQLGPRASLRFSYAVYENVDPHGVERIVDQCIVWAGPGSLITFSFYL